MTILLALVGGYALALLIGKQSKKIDPPVFVVLCLLALAQVGAVMYVLFTMESPIS